MEVHFPKGKYVSKKVADTSPPRTSMGLPSHNFNSKPFYLPLFFGLKSQPLGIYAEHGKQLSDGSEFSHTVAACGSSFSLQRSGPGTGTHARTAR